MSIRWRAGRPIVEVYDPVSKRKRHVRHTDFDLTPPPLDASRRTLERWAKRLEATALAARDQARPASLEETCDAFVERWTRDFSGPTERGRSESTRVRMQERVSLFAVAFVGRTLRSVTRAEAREFGKANPARVPALCAMYNDAVRERLADDNPFSRLGIARSPGRAELVVLTVDEVHDLALLARRHGGGQLGEDLHAMVMWSAYTCMRPGEIFAARYSRLDGDTYDVREQFNSVLRREAEPKHGSRGVIYVPREARDAVLERPRRLGDDLMFRTRRGRQFRQGSWHYSWEPIRSAFAEKLAATHPLRERLAIDPEDKLDLHELRHFGASHMLNILELEPWVIAQQLRHTDGGALVLRLYGHPERRVALDRIRRAYSSSSLTRLPEVSGDSRGTSARKG